MHQLDLSTLSGPELRSLLDSARERGQAAQSYEILQEMARRRDGDAAEGRPRLLKGRRRPAEPRIITLDLGDPLEPRDDDPFEAPEPPRLEDPAADVEPPLTLARDPEPARAAKPPKPPKPPKPVRVRRGPGSALGFAVGALGGMVLGVAFGGSVGEALFPPPDVELAEAAQLPPPPPPLPEAAPAPPPGVMGAAPPQVETIAAETLAAPSAESAELVQDAGAVAEAPEPEPAATPAETACAGESTPADRTICEDADLQRLQRELRQAYAEALAAHEARDLLRQRQLAWRDARNTVSDPQRLAGLYEARIRKLKAATADAKAAR